MIIIIKNDHHISKYFIPLKPQRFGKGYNIYFMNEQDVIVLIVTLYFVDLR